MSDDLPQGQQAQQNQIPAADDGMPPVQPVGTPHKEQAPPIAPVQPPAPEAALPQAVEVSVPSEQRETVQEEGKESPLENREQVPSSEQVPVQPTPSQQAAPVQPVQTAPEGPSLPLSYTQAEATIKEKPITESASWFAKLIELLWKRRDPTIGKKKE